MRREFSTTVRKAALKRSEVPITPERKAWINMKSRCNNERTPKWSSYGGRGITVCDRWNSSFDCFLADVGPRPSPQHSLDRIDVNGNYEPANVRWATRKRQQRNRRCNRILSVNGRDITLAEAAEYASVKYNTVLYRLKRGWSVEDSLALPDRRGRRP